MRLELLPIEALVPDPDNPRSRLWGIDALAQSIEQHGLLHNLVAVPHGEHFMLRSGHRRHAALTRLIEAGKMPNEVPVLIIDSGNGVFESLAANVHQEDITPWAMGLRMLELREAGFTQPMIAAKLNVSPGWVSSRLAIAEFLCPAVITKLNTLGPKHGISLNTLSRMAKCYDPRTFEPDEKEQMRMLERAIAIPGRVGLSRRSPLPEKSRVFQRYMKLKKGALKISSRHARIIDQLVRYLSGESSRLELD